MSDYNINLNTVSTYTLFGMTDSHRQADLHRQTDRQTDRETERQAGRQTDRQTDIQTEKQHRSEKECRGRRCRYS